MIPGHDHPVLPTPALRTSSPRTAAQLAAAGMGVAIVPASALIPRPDGTIRPFDPPEQRDVIATVTAPHDDLLRRFVADLKRRGLPAIPFLNSSDEFFETMAPLPEA